LVTSPEAASIAVVGDRASFPFPFAGFVFHSLSAKGGNCVEVGTADRAVAVRDSSDSEGPRLAFAANTWKAFAEQVKAGA
jgi:hypothetical protein